jgi:cold shock CspA family protein
MTTGTIKKVVADRGFGFITAAASTARATTD